MKETNVNLSTHKPKVCVIGAGAIGGFFGAQLAQGHADVSVIARGATLHALRRDGWTFENAAGRTSSPVRATSDPRELGPQDIVILAVKAYALADIAPLVAPLLHSDTIVVPALNGVPWWFTLGDNGLPIADRLRSLDPDGAIEASIPTGRLVGAVVYPACSSPGPGVVRHSSGTRLVFGEPALRTAPSERVRQLVEWLRGAGFDAEATASIRSEIWKKLLGNACFNPVSMLVGASTDKLIDDPSLHALFEAMMSETLAVGRALGLDLEIRVPDRIAVTRKLGTVKTSMLQDIEAGRQVELDAILGAVNEIATTLGQPTPINDSIFALARMRAITLGLLKP
jgi:2-dehydropantoate 2-reductase